MGPTRLVAVLAEMEHEVAKLISKEKNLSAKRVLTDLRPCVVVFERAQKKEYRRNPTC
jgi:hypothetical protein